MTAAETTPSARDESRYRALMRRLAPRLRREGEEELVETFRQVYARTRPRTRLEAMRFWAHMAADLMVASVDERLSLTAARRRAGGGGLMVAFRLSFASATARDVRTAARRLVRAPGWTLLAAFTLALGLGASVLTAVLVRDVLLRPLPFPDADRLVRLIEIDEKGGTWWPSYPNASDWRAHARFLDGVGIADIPSVRPVGIDGSAVRVPVSRAASGFFETLGAQPIVGRLFAADEQRPGGPAAAVVSEAFWRGPLRAQPLGTARVTVNDEQFVVVGVLPAGFYYLGEGAAWSEGPAVWTPMDRAANLGRRTSHGYHVVARLNSTQSIEQARVEMTQLARTLKAQHREPTQADSVRMTPLRDYAVRNARAPLQWLQYAGIGVLIVTCLNLAGALLAQGIHRSREFAIRLSLGASRATLVRALVAEAALLSVPGVLFGLLLASSGLRAMRAFGGRSLPRLNEVQLDGAAVALAIAAALGSAVLAGVIPAVALSRRSHASRLRVRGAIGEGRGHRRLWTSFVVLQIALTVALLCGAGLLMRSFRTAASVDLGYRPQGVFVVDVELPLTRFVEPERLAAYYTEALARLRATPGLAAAGLTSRPPSDTTAYTASTHRDVPDAKSTFAGYRIVDPGYFDAIGISSARLPADAFGAGRGVVDERLHAQLWSGGSAVGDRVLNSFSTTPINVTGVVGTVREWAQGEGTIGVVYVDYRTRPIQAMHFVVRPEASTRDAATVIRDVFARFDPLVPVTVTPLETMLAESFSGRRLTLLMTTGFGVVAMLLAFSAVYALVSFAVARQQREAAIRLALGARPSSIGRRVLAQGTIPAVVGTGLGLLLTLPLASVIEAQLFQVRASDPWTLAMAGLATIGAAFVASIAPSRRAARANPVSALRLE